MYNSHQQMPTIVKIKKGDTTMVGISKGYATGTTAITSNPDNISVSHGPTNFSIHSPKNNGVFMSQTQNEILNYPYAYD